MNSTTLKAARWAFRWASLALLFALSGTLTSSNAWDGPEDNRTDVVRRLPKLGLPISDENRARWSDGLKSLSEKIAQIQALESPLKRLWPDVAIYHKAVHCAIEYQEFFEESQFALADQLLATGHERADQLLRGESPWTTATGLIARGYVSEIDGSVQPFGLVIPSGFRFDDPRPMPVDLWFHGRGETLSELQFIAQRQTSAGQFAPVEAIVVHPYGRYCNANKFAGEVDVYEALAATEREYRIDPDRISVRGFSMGGASAWQLAVHDPGRWAAANPGAGFSETPEFLQTFQSETLNPYWWERRLWRWYDCTDWASNLRHVPTIAYSGEIDRQIQAATAMERAATKEGISLLHLIGPQTAHSYHPETAAEVERRLREFVRIGRDRTPRSIDFTTYTLRYPTMRWITVTGLASHWSKGRIRGQILNDSIELRVEGITAFDLRFEPGTFPFVMEPEIRIWHRQGDRWVRSTLPASSTGIPVNGMLSTDRSWVCRLVSSGQGWRLRGTVDDEQLQKQPGLQGPVDDAFMEPFLFVTPSGTSSFPAASTWAQAEMQRAIEHWRRHFRGDARIKADHEVTDEDMAKYNVVLWGDSESNLLWKRMAEQLPIRLNEGQWQVGDQSYDAQTHAPIFIYPNPLARQNYIVANSSFTFRDYAYLNNARQVPMLPDWAMIDLREPAGYVYPGGIAAADFFDEKWQIILPIPEPVRVPPPGVHEESVVDPQGNLEPVHQPRLATSRSMMSALVRSYLAETLLQESQEPTLDSLESLGEPVIGAERKPTIAPDVEYWLRNLIEIHGFAIPEIEAATGLSVEEIRSEAERLNLRPFAMELPAEGEPLLVAPYPGGRHPRIGFLDGAVRPQRETKVSVFLPWDRGSYVVCDFPEAIWSDLGLTYLAHTHVETIWDQQKIELPTLEWLKTDSGDLLMERELPNGIKFGTQVRSLPDHVAFKMWLVNGTDEVRSDLRVQNCVMLKAARGFEAQSNDNKVIRGSLVAVHDEARSHWIISGWQPIHRPWANAPCPCLHADPKFPDCAPGERQELFGWLSFYSGENIDEELARIEALDWKATWK